MSSSETHEGSVQQVLDRVSDAFFALDTEWQFTYANEQAATVLNRSREDLRGEVVWDAFPEAEDSQFYDEYSAAMDEQETRSFEAYYPPLESWFNVHAYPSDTGLSVYFEDVTDEHERSLDLARYERIVETMGDGVYVVDEEGRFQFVNDPYTEMVGYDREDLVGAPVTKVVDEEVRESAAELESQLRDGDVETVSKEAVIDRPDGERVVAEATFSLMESDDETERVAVVHDVTERKQRQSQLEEHRDMLSAQVERTDLVQRINQATLGATTRDEIREAVCDILTDSEFYQVAWVGHREDGDLCRQAGAGVSGAELDDLVAAAAKAGDVGQVAQALDRGTVQVQQHISESDTDPRQELFTEQDYHSSISLPLEHDGYLFGVLTIDSERSHAFGGTERDLLSNLADTIAYALRTVEERKRYQSVVDDVLDSAVDAGILIYDSEGTLEWVNNRTESLLGVSREAVVGQSVEAFIEETLQSTFDRGVDIEDAESWLAESEDGPSEYHLTGNGIDGESFVERLCAPIESGLYAGGSVALYYDITSRKESERRAAQSERRQRTLLQNLPGMAYRCRPGEGWPMEFVSEGCASLTGYDPEVLESGDVSWGEDVIHYGDQDEVRKTVDQALNSDVPYEVTYRIVTADDETRWVWEQGRKVVTLDGESRLEGFITDVSERRRRREELQRQYELNQQLFETSPVGILAFEADGSLAHANETAVETFDIDADATDGAVSTRDYDYSVGDMGVADEGGQTIPPEERPVYRTLMTGERITDETVSVTTPAGDRRWLSYQSAPVYNEDGEVELAVVTADDITETKARQAELARLDHVNSVIRRLNSTLIESNDQETIKETVAAELATAAPYEAAWYADVDLSTDELVPVTIAGIDDPPADAAVPVDGTLQGEAVTNDEVRVGELPADHPFADSLPDGEDGTTALAAVPVTYGETQYGLLCLAAPDETAFSSDIQDVFDELGDLVGHALTAIVRKEGLRGGRATRLEFRFRDYVTENYDLEHTPDEISLRFDDTISLPEGGVLQYFTIPESAESVLTDLFESNDRIERFRQLEVPDESEERRYEVKQSSAPLIDVLADLGGRIVSVTGAEGDLHVVAELPTSADVRDVVEQVTEVHPSADLEAQRSVEASEREAPTHLAGILDSMTERQRTVLESAHFAGYFEWPRATTGEEVAESLDLSPSTFSQHLRAGERKTFAGLFGDD